MHCARFSEATTLQQCLWVWPMMIGICTFSIEVTMSKNEDVAFMYGTASRWYL
jgi:hypothetical protein